MRTRHFSELLAARMNAGFTVCVGLDSDHTRLPATIKSIGWGMEGMRMRWFNFLIVEATAEVALAFKPNIAFYAPHGSTGLTALRDTIRFIQARYPEVPVILDAKRTDIGSTNNGYVEEAFQYFGADAITVNPYFGAEALTPFLEREEKGILVLCRTSNPGAGEFQDLLVGSEQTPLYQVVAKRVASEWNKNGNCGLVVGATYPEELAQVRQIAGDMPILIPGTDTQGGEVEATVRAGANSRGQGMIINSSRSIIFASSGPDFAQAASTAAQKLHRKIQAALAAAA